MSYLVHESIKEFPINTYISARHHSFEGVRFGWIAGLSISDSNDLVFKVIWADSQLPAIVHPDYVRPVDHDWSCDE